jgi:hypothetical protein
MLDNFRAALVVAAALWCCVALASGRPPSVGGRRLWFWPPVVLFLAGLAADPALAPSPTLIGPTLLAMWCALTAAHRNDAAAICLIAAPFTGVTVASIVGTGGVEFTHEDGGTARSVALGLLLVTVGVCRALCAARQAGSRGHENVLDPAAAVEAVGGPRALRSLQSQP